MCAMLMVAVPYAGGCTATGAQYDVPMAGSPLQQYQLGTGQAQTPHLVSKFML